MFPFEWLLYPLKPVEHINISQPLPLFSLFQEPFAIMKVVEEIFKVNGNKDVKDMALCDFTQDTHQPQHSPKKPLVTSTILTTLPQDHSFTPHSSKHPQKQNP